jgi:hypothetical protein
MKFFLDLIDEAEKDFEHVNGLILPELALDEPLTNELAHELASELLVIPAKVLIGLYRLNSLGRGSGHHLPLSSRTSGLRAGCLLASVQQPVAVSIMVSIVTK